MIYSVRHHPHMRHELQGPAASQKYTAASTTEEHNQRRIRRRRRRRRRRREEAMAGRVHTQKLVHILLLGFLAMPFFILTLLKPQVDPFSLFNYSQLASARTSIRIEVVQNERILDAEEGEVMVRSVALESEIEEKLVNTNNADQEKVDLLPSPVPEVRSNTAGSPVQEIHSNESQRNVAGSPVQEIHSKESQRNAAGSPVQEIHSKESQRNAAENKFPGTEISCDFSQQRTDTCVLHGDVRILGSSSSILLLDGSQPAGGDDATAHTVRPYARKWEAPVMELIRPVSIKSSSQSSAADLKCTAYHDVPGIVFSTGGFVGKNFFHDFSDVLVPLFITSRQYHGRVKFLVNNFNPRWISRYEVILRRLSHYGVINLDVDAASVHCFRTAHVGLLSHGELAIDPARTPGNYSMADFRELLRSSLSLRRKSVSISPDAKPRLLLMLRKGSRALTNRREVVSLVRRVGYRVVVTWLEGTRNLSRFAGVVNSCDVMMGVHGAGLTNEIFLPINATLIQIIPWGGLRYASNNDYGAPLAAMGVRYLEYEVGKEESSLVRQYPRDHPVLADPLSVHRQGWEALWAVFLNRQSIKVDVRRLRAVLQEAFRSVPRWSPEIHLI